MPLLRLSDLFSTSVWAIQIGASAKFQTATSHGPYHFTPLTAKCISSTTPLTLLGKLCKPDDSTSTFSDH